MAAVATTTAVAAGATVAASQAQKKGAEKSAQAFKKVGKAPVNVKRIERGVRALLGGDQSNDEDAENRYKVLQDRSWEVASDQIQGRLSSATRDLIGRQAAEMGANLGSGVVGDLNTGFLGITTEQRVAEGFANYRNLFGQLTSVFQGQQAYQYNAEFNRAAATASSEMAKANATAGMWQGLASIAGGLAGGIGGGAGAAAGGGGIGWQNMMMAGGNQQTGPSTIPAGYVPRTTSQRPPGI